MRAKTSPMSTVEKILHPKFTAICRHLTLFDGGESYGKMLTEYIVGNGASEITVHHLGLLLHTNEKVLGASPDGAFFCDLDRANIPTSSVIEYKNLKKLVDAGLSVSEAVDTKVKDSHLLEVKTTKYS